MESLWGLWSSQAFSVNASWRRIWDPLNLGSGVLLPSCLGDEGKGCSFFPRKRKKNAWRRWIQPDHLTERWGKFMHPLLNCYKTILYRDIPHSLFGEKLLKGSFFPLVWEMRKKDVLFSPKKKKKRLTQVNSTGPLDWKMGEVHASAPELL